MPKVKQADYDLNAIITELIGTDEDLHREIMSNIIEGNPYELKIVEQPKTRSFKSEQSVLHFKVEAVGLGLKYQWQYRRSGTDWNIASAGTPKSKSTYYSWNASREGQYLRCEITDKFGNVIYSDTVQMNRGF